MRLKATLANGYDYFKLQDAQMGHGSELIGVSSPGNATVYGRRGETVSKKAFNKIAAGLQDAISIKRGEMESSRLYIHGENGMKGRATMKKADCDRAIRSFTHDWARETGFVISSGDMPSFSAFKAWLRDKGYGHYLEFRSLRGPDEDAEQWFDQELKQTWRN